MVSAAAALAAGTPLTPSPGATVRTAHPHFTWALPAGEQSQGIFVADKPAVIPEGRFYDENIVAFGVLAPNDRAWSPSSPLYAGRYWWNVWSSDQDTHALYSAPAGFTIPVALSLRGVGTRRYPSLHSMEVHVRWRANVQRPLVRVRALRGRKIVWKASRKEYNAIGSPGSTSFSWRPRRIEPGTRLKLVASISSGRVRRARALVVRAP
jgi:hypothetical protein